MFSHIFLSLFVTFGSLLPPQPLHHEEGATALTTPPLLRLWVILVFRITHSKEIRKNMFNFYCVCVSLFLFPVSYNRAKPKGLKFWGKIILQLWLFLLGCASNTPSYSKSPSKRYDVSPTVLTQQDALAAVMAVPTQPFTPGDYPSTLTILWCGRWGMLMRILWQGVEWSENHDSHQAEVPTAIIVWNNWWRFRTALSFNFVRGKKIGYCLPLNDRVLFQKKVLTRLQNHLTIERNSQV